MILFEHRSGRDRAQHAMLMQIPGVDWLVAAVLIAEIGVDMSVFLSACHLGSLGRGMSRQP